jgi:hypothetical protein
LDIEVRPELVLKLIETCETLFLNLINTEFFTKKMGTLHFPVYNSNVVLPFVNASKYLKCFGGGTFSRSLSFISDN